MKAALRLLAAMALVAAAGLCHPQDSDSVGSSEQSVRAQGEDSTGRPAQSASASQATRSPTPTPQASPTPTPNPNETLENTLAAGDSPDEPRRQLVHWNEYAGPYFTFRAGGGLLLETIGFSQDAESKQQFRLKPDYRLRDFRFL